MVNKTELKKLSIMEVTDTDEK
jgi:hypothetical protein